MIKKIENMKSIKVLLLLLFLGVASFAQEKEFEANWKSLDSRPIPSWFEDAKFGIFIHWGPYSVPAWSPKGTYSEWYQYWLQSKSLFGNGNFSGAEVFDYQKNTYGEESTYYDFGEMFTADLFNPDEWANLFEKSGAKYIVVTSKHHDGYCLWPSKEANDRGFAWNSVDVGAHRDLLGDLTEAVRKTDVKMGFYYSLYEWYHPLWLNDRESFVVDHFHPQFKDLVESYQPDLLWGDGEWEMDSKSWKTPKLMQWLYNESSVKNNIVINDRWGQETRNNYGGYFTTEYESDVNFDRPWEECRGMGFSFGYNRNEDIQDYNSAKTMVLMLCDIVSQGGTLLLDIGPDSRGRIPVIMQERLLQIGDWLNVNGDAIYSSRKWKNSVQWSDGDRDCKEEGKSYVGGDYIIKQTIDPISPNCAVKEMFFTYKNGNLFAIVPKWPEDNLVVKNLNLKDESRVIFLDSGDTLSWKNVDGNVEISIPNYNPNSIRNDLAFVFKITDVKAFCTNPTIKSFQDGFCEKVDIELSTGKNAKVFYTIDGSTPTKKSTLYKGIFSVEKSVEIKCVAFENGKNSSDIISENITFHDQVKNIELEFYPSNKFSAKGVISLMDNVEGSLGHNDGNWLGFESVDAEMMIDFGKKRKINKISVGCLESQKSWIFAPKTVEYYTSSDGDVEFTKIGELFFDSDVKSDEIRRVVIEKEFDTKKSRFLKIIVKNIATCPTWHDGAGEKSWLFVDEIVIE